MNPGPVLRLDREGTVLVGNAAARRFFGQTELIGSCWLDLCPGMDGEVWGRVLESRNAFSHEAETGGACMVFTHVRSETGRFVFVFGADITDRRAAERRLAEVARFPDMNPGPVLRLGLDGVVLLANVAAREVFGAELADRCWLDLCPGMDPDVWRGVLEAAEPVLFAARIGNREYVFTHRREAGGELVFVFGADVTQEKQSERALRQSQKMATLGTLAAGVAHELNNPAAATSRAADQLRDAVAQLEEAHLRLDAAGLTPEAREQLKTLEQQARERAARADDLDPMERSDREAAVEEWLEEHGVDEPWQLAPLLARRGLDPPELSRLATVFQGEALPAALTWAGTAFSVYTLLHEIGQGSTRISEIVRALKSYSYLGQAPVQAVDRPRGTGQHAGDSPQQAQDRHRRCTGSTRRPAARCAAHGSELNQVWTNLLDNAADAMGGQGQTSPSGPAATATTSSSRSRTTGRASPRRSSTQVFDPFFTTKEPGKGTGLGLSTSLLHRRRRSTTGEIRASLAARLHPLHGPAPDRAHATTGRRLTHEETGDPHRRRRPRGARRRRARPAATTTAATTASSRRGVRATRRSRPHAPAQAARTRPSRSSWSTSGCPEMTGTELLAEVAPVASRRPQGAAHGVRRHRGRDRGDQRRRRCDHYLLKPWDPPERAAVPGARRPAVGLDRARASPVRRASASSARAGRRTATPRKDFLSRNQVPYQWVDIDDGRQLRALARRRSTRRAAARRALPRRHARWSRPSHRRRWPSASACRLVRPGRSMTWSSSAAVRPAWPARCTGRRRGCAPCSWSRTPPAARPAPARGSRTTSAFRRGSPAPTWRAAPPTQAKRFGAELLTAQEVVALRREDPYRVVELADGSEVSCYTVLMRARRGGAASSRCRASRR